MRAARPRQAVTAGARPRALGLLAAALVAAGCGERAGAPPRPTAVSPARGAPTAPVAVRIHGTFGTEVTTDFSGDGGGVVDARYAARLGTTPLEDVALRQDGGLDATVPAGLAPGTYALTVVDPSGRTGTLAQAYLVLAPGAPAVPVAAFRVDPVGAQVAYAPFTVTITALDATGAVVADFAGEARLSDRTETVAPPSVGLFVDGRWTGTVEVRAPHAADLLTVSEPGGATGSASFAVAPAPAASVRFVTAAPAAQAGACTGPITAALRDAFGVPTTAAGSVALSVAAAPSTGAAQYADAACAVPLGDPVVAPGQGTASFWMRATAAGPVQLTASGAALGGDVLAGTVAAGPPASVAFVTPPRTAAAGACSAAPATLEVRDAWGNPSPAGLAALTLTATPGAAFTLYADACATPATSLSVPAGATTASFHFRGTAARTVQVAASAAGLAGASQDEVVAPGPAVALAFASPPRRAAAGACSPALVVEARDGEGNPAPVAAPAPLELAAAPVAGFTLHADAACTTPAAGAAIAAGASSATLYYRGTRTAEVGVTASAAGLGSASQPERVDPAAPAALVFASAPAQALAVHACSGAATLAVVDAFGNASPVAAAVDVSLDAPPASGVSFYADPGCTVLLASATVAAGADTATFHFSAAEVGAPVVSARASGLAEASQPETIVAAGASQLAFASPDKTVPAGDCSGAVTLEARDAWGNPGPVSPPAATSVSLEVVPAGRLTLHAGPSCAGGAVTAVTLAAGARTTTFSFSGDVAGAAVVQATATGLGAASQAETIVAGPATRLAFATAPQTVTAGLCSGPTTLESRDAADNPSVVSSTAATTVTLGGADLAFFAGAGCTGGPIAELERAAGATATTISVRGTVAGAVGITATPAASGLGGATQAETIRAGPTDRYAWSTIASPQPENAPFAVTITAVDANGNRTDDAGTVTLAASSGTVRCASACTSAAETGAFTGGQWTGTVLVPAAASGLTLTATGSGRTGTSDPFDVGGPASRSPPFARYVASARVITSGNSVTFDASASSDYQTAATSLSVSWDFEARDADQASTVPPGTAPTWTGWSTARTASHAFINNTGAPIVYRPRLAVRDTEAGPGGPDVGYASGVVVVLPDASNVCVVDTDSLADDNGGSTSCDVKGTDGHTSLPEALRVANASPAATVNVVFSGTRDIVSAGGTSLAVSRAVRIVANPGTVRLDGVSLVISGWDVLVSGLELTRLATPLTVTGDALLEDLHVHDGEGIEVQGRARVLRARMSACSGAACIREDGGAAYLAVFTSDLAGSGSGVGVALDRCQGAAPALLGSSPYDPFVAGWSYSGSAAVIGTVLTGFATGVSVGSGCAHAVVGNDTFDGNGVGVSLGAATTGYLADDVFSNQTTAAVTPASCTVDLNTHQLVHQNASDGCVGDAASLRTGDPLYVYPSARDFRIQYASPARDAGESIYGVELDDAGPGRHLGAAPDRGGRETY